MKAFFPIYTQTLETLESLVIWDNDPKMINVFAQITPAANLEPGNIPAEEA